MSIVKCSCFYRQTSIFVSFPICIYVLLPWILFSQLVYSCILLLCILLPPILSRYLSPCAYCTVRTVPCAYAYCTVLVCMMYPCSCACTTRAHMHAVPVRICMMYPCAYACCTSARVHAVPVRVCMLYQCAYACCTSARVRAVSVRICVLYQCAYACCTSARVHAVPVRVCMSYPSLAYPYTPALNATHDLCDFYDYSDECNSVEYDNTLPEEHLRCQILQVTRKFYNVQTMKHLLALNRS